MLIRAASMLTTVALVVGLVWWIVAPATTATVLLSAGLLALMATPVAQLVGAVAEEIRAGDWRFALVGLGVLVLLCVSAFVSLRR